jgi:serine/threonine protein phosphatase PrpC
VGLIEGAAYASETLVFGEGDVITLVSDGISEALDVALDLLPAAIAEAVSDARPRTPEAVCRHLIEVTHGSHGPREIDGWADDRTVVAFGIVAPPNATGSTQSFNSTP